MIVDGNTRHLTLVFMQLLRKNPHLRLGARRKDMKTILNHGFFREMDWAALLDRRVDPPIVPIIVSVTRNLRKNGNMSWNNTDDMHLTIRPIPRLQR